MFTMDCRGICSETVRAVKMEMNSIINVWLCASTGYWSGTEEGLKQICGSHFFVYSENMDLDQIERK